MITPDYYDKFKCIGSECKNNCCMGEWDIEVDDAAMDRFSAIVGDFGDLVRASIDNENVFIRKNGKCPLLSDTGLCEMVLHGEKLCIICDEYPRYTEFYGDYCERGISLSCEAATKIILDNTDIVNCVGNSGKCDEDIFELLYRSRDIIFEILQDRTMDIKKRIRLVLDYGEKLQEHINNNEYSEFIYHPIDKFYEFQSVKPIFDFLKTLDCMSNDWRECLDTYSECNFDEVKLEQLAVYFVYRYFLKAVFDCDALSKLKLMAISVVAIAYLQDACGSIYESARHYSIEVEHNEDNIEMIYEEFIFNDELSTEKIINMIK